MINRSPQLSALRSGLLIDNKRLNAYFSIAVILLTGCTATQVRWDATKMRKDVMVYYNDQIMDNLIRAKNRLPFVHVDITLLTSQGGSQISGTIGAGENRTNTNTSKSMMVMGALGTVANAVSRPFGWSVTPQQTETLTISTAPALGPQAVAAPEETTSKKPPMQITKWTDAWEITYPTPSPSPALSPPETVKGTQTSEWATTQSTIYDLYDNFARDYVEYKSIPPGKHDVLPGTVIKLWGGNYYYIDNNKTVCRNAKCKDAKEAYYDFCKKLFTKGQAGLLGSAVQQNLAAPLAVPSR
jgi:hypothetical protein